MFCHHLLIVREKKIIKEKREEKGKENSGKRGKKIAVLGPALIQPTGVQGPESMPPSLCGGTFL